MSGPPARNRQDVVGRPGLPALPQAPCTAEPVAISRETVANGRSEWNRVTETVESRVASELGFQVGSRDEPLEGGTAAGEEIASAVTRLQGGRRSATSGNPQLAGQRRLPGRR